VHVSKKVVGTPAAGEMVHKPRDSAQTAGMLQSSIGVG
jgi:hypothetical protein